MSAIILLNITIEQAKKRKEQEQQYIYIKQKFTQESPELESSSLCLWDEFKIWLQSKTKRN
jgi:hypothetical protein